MADQPLRICLVGATPGAGWGPRAHVPAYKALPEVELAAVCTAHEESAQVAAKEFGAPKHYSDYQAMLKDPEIDVVSVATRILLHHPISKAALEAGKHVYCEWPLCVTSAQAGELSSLAKQRGLGNMTGLQARFAPPLLRMKELLDDGYVGKPLTFHLSMFGGGALTPRPSTSGFLARKDSGFGALSIAGGHTIDALCWLLGDIESLSAQVDSQINEWTFPDTGQLVPVTSPDNVSFIARLASGAVGSVQVSNTAMHGSGFRLDVHGAEGKLTATSPALIELSLITLRGAKTGEQEQEIPVPDRLVQVLGLDLGSAAYNIAALFRGFAKAIRSGADLAPNFQDGARMHRLLEAIDRSSETRSWVIP